MGVVLGLGCCKDGDTLGWGHCEDGAQRESGDGGQCGDVIQRDPRDIVGMGTT